MKEKKIWKKPELHKINLGRVCNPAHPQIDVCEIQGTPQQSQRCAQNKVGLS